jgi:hypothetical protein
MLSTINYEKFKNDVTELDGMSVGIRDFFVKENEKIIKKLSEFKEIWIRNNYERAFGKIFRNENLESLSLKEYAENGMTFIELYWGTTLMSVLAYKFDFDNINHMTLKFTYEDLFINYPEMEKIMRGMYG